MNLIGIDLAWQSDKNTSAAAVGELKVATLSIHALQEDLDSVDAIADLVCSYPEVAGIAIDAHIVKKYISLFSLIGPELGGY